MGGDRACTYVSHSRMADEDDFFKGTWYYRVCDSVCPHIECLHEKYTTGTPTRSSYYTVKGTSLLLLTNLSSLSYDKLHW